MSPENYSDIIGLPPHKSKSHAGMTRAGRAAQFAPFAALTGFGDAVTETARYTSERRELSEDEIAEINCKLVFLSTVLKERPAVSITYFLPDSRKKGGAYITEETVIKRIDSLAGEVETENGAKIKMEDIFAVDLLNK